MQQRFSIRGMHCASCEIVIEDELKKLTGIISASVSHARGEAVLDCDEGARIAPADLTRACVPHGYTFHATETLKNASTNTAGELPVWIRLGGVAVILLALFMILDRMGFFRFSPSVDNPSGFAGVFAVGLIAAVSSCAAIVGGLLVAVSVKYAQRHPNANRAHKLRPHLLFNTGRLVGFAAFGAALGWIGQGISLSPGVNGFLVLVLGIVLVGFGVNLMRILPKNLPVPKPPKSLARLIHRFTESEHPAVPFFLGAATFFLPCGFTQAMQLYALSLGDPLQSAAVMSVFALGTLPALLGIGAFTSVAKGRTLTRFGQIAGAFILVLGIANFQNGAALLDWRLPSPTLKTAPAVLAPVPQNGRQTIAMNVTSYGTYEPAALTVVENIPVVWNITGADFMGCASTLVLPAFGVSAYLRPGPNTVTFTPTRIGCYTFSCSMGMVRGTMNVIPNTN